MMIPILDPARANTDPLYKPVLSDCVGCLSDLATPSSPPYDDPNPRFSKGKYRSPSTDQSSQSPWPFPWPSRPHFHISCSATRHPSAPVGSNQQCTNHSLPLMQKIGMSFPRPRCQPPALTFCHADWF